MQLSGYESWVLLAGAMVSQYIDQTFQVPKMEVLMYVSCMDATYVSMKRVKKNGDILQGLNRVSSHLTVGERVQKSSGCMFPAN